MIATKTLIRKAKHLRNISRKKPTNPWIKINVDGAYQNNPGREGAGGLIRDCFGRWRKGFMVNIGINSNTVAELWPIWKGFS